MLDPETTAFLGTGCALIVGTVDDDGAPHATRGWGALVLPATTGRIRLLVDADDHEPIEHLRPGSAIAVTATSVRTLRSVQLKGSVLAVVDPTDEDVARAAEYCRQFYADIVETDGVEPELPARLTPERYLAVEIEVHELYDQTPGPRAGRALDEAAR